MKPLAPSKPPFAFGIECFYLLVALATGLALGTGEDAFVERARVFLEIDLLLVVVAGLAYVFVFKEKQPGSSNWRRMLLGLPMFALIASPFMEQVSRTLRTQGSAPWSEGELAAVGAVLAYDLVVRIMGLQQAKQSDPMPNFAVLTFSDLGVMLVMTDAAERHGASLLHVPACYGIMAFARLALREFFKVRT